MTRWTVLILLFIGSACSADKAERPASPPVKQPQQQRPPARDAAPTRRPASIRPVRGPIISRDGTILAHDVDGQRRYPTSLASHVVGYTKRDGSGAAGLEHKYDAYLAGKPGRSPISGNRIVLTIDAALQRAVEGILAKHTTGAAVVMDVKTGAILALASVPSVNRAKLRSANYVRGALRDPRKPFLNKVLLPYRPGLQFATFSALAALESKASRAGDHHVCTGATTVGSLRLSCSGRHGRVSLADAFDRGCRVYFWEQARATGLDAIARWARRFGFGAKTGLPLTPDATGRVPDVAWYRRRGPFRAGYTMNASVGLGDVEVTPMQLARAYAALATGGRVLKPGLVHRVTSADGATMFRHNVELVRRVPLTKTTRAGIHRGLVAAARKQTPASVGLAGLVSAVLPRFRRVKAMPKYWFAGYAPHDDPAIAIALFFTGPKADSKAAWAAAAHIARAYGTGK